MESLLKESPFSSPQPIDLQDNFLTSFAGISCEARHKQTSLGAYIMKQIRSNMMQLMMMLTIVLSLLGITASRTDIFKQISGLFQQYPWIFGLVISFVFFMLINAYNQEKNLKITQAEEKLKKDLSSYYQSFSKNLLEKVIQDLHLALESEERKISDRLKYINDMYRDYILERDKKQAQIKKNIEQYKTQQESLKKESSEFNKLKRM